MNHSIKLLTAAVMAASLAACGGGSDDDEDGGGTGGGSGGNGTGGGGAALTVKQVQWYGHEAAFTGVSLAGLAYTSLSTIYGGPYELGAWATVDCTDGGSFTQRWNDKDGSGGFDKGDTLEVSFDQCGSASGLLHGPLLLTIGDNLADETAGTMTYVTDASFGTGFRVDETQVSGSFTIDEIVPVHPSTGLQTGDTTYQLSIPELTLVSSFAGSAYSTRIADYDAAFFVPNTGTGPIFQLESIAFGASGSDPVLGDGYSYTTKTTDTVVFDSDAGLLEGVFEIAARGETLTVSFTYAGDQAGPGDVAFTATGGANSTLTYAQFDDLAP